VLGEPYLNIAEFGPGVFGAGAASELLLGKMTGWKRGLKPKRRVDTFGSDRRSRGDGVDRRKDGLTA
jgi:hypothetical protein